MSALNPSNKKLDHKQAHDRNDNNGCDSTSDENDYW